MADGTEQEILVARPGELSGDRDHCLDVLDRKQRRPARRHAHQGHWHRSFHTLKLFRNPKNLEGLVASSLEVAGCDEPVDNASGRPG